MDKTSTPKITLSSLSVRKKNRPSELTLAILRQFARTYHVEPGLSPSVNSLVLN